MPHIISDNVAEGLRSIMNSLLGWSGQGMAKVYLHPSDAKTLATALPPLMRYNVDRRPVMYLGGPIAGCTDEEAMEWRAYVKERLGNRFDFIDPMSRDYRGNTTVPPHQIVEADLADIKASDVVVSYLWRRSHGSIMEVPYAKLFGKIVLVICGDHYPSPWLQYHATHLYLTLEDMLVAWS